MRYTPYYMCDVRRAAARSRFTFASAFTGAGIADIGYMLAGGRAAFGIELDPEAVRTFRENFADTHIEHLDFREASASPEVINRMLAQAALQRGELDVFHASPPCNEFSKLGRGPQPGGNAGLIFDVVNMTKIMRPRVLVIENVPELGGRHRAYLDAALKMLRVDDTGRRLYYANALVLKADDYGVPQRRRRLFAIAVRADIAESVGIRSDDDVLMLFPAPTHELISAKEALADLPQTDAELHPWRRAMMTSNLAQLARRLEHDPNRPMTPPKAGLGTNRFNTIRAAAELPFPTITASGQQPDGRSGILHMTEDRKLSLREMMRGTACPEDMILTGTLGQAVTRIGMAVPPLMTKAIADALYALVIGPYNAAIARDEKSEVDVDE